MFLFSSLFKYFQPPVGLRSQSPRFLLMVFIIYGLQQGLCQSWLIIGRNYYFKDILQLTSFHAQIFVAITWVPLNIKPLYGILSDTIGIFGYYRTPYLLLASICGIICQTLLSCAVTPSSTLVCIFMMGINLSIAVPDVVIDASITTMAQNNEQLISDLHTFCSGAFAICSIIGYLTSGLVIQTIGVQNLFFLSSVVSLLVFICASLGFLNESQDLTSSSSIITIRKDLYKRNPSIFLNALFVCFIAITLTVTMILFQNNLQYQLIVIIISSLLLVTIPYSTLRSTSLPVAQMTIILFSCDALTPNIETMMFYWYTNATDGPQFSSSYIGTMSMIGYCATFVGVLLFYKYCRHFSYRTLYMTSQIFLCLTGLLDLLIVFKHHPTNNSSSSFLFADPLLVLLGDIIFFPFFRRFKILPSLILTSKLCPSGLEATLYAMFMSLINLGETIALYSGSLLLNSLGVVNGNYSNLPYGIIIKSLFRLFLLPVLIFFTPSGSPSPPQAPSLSPSSPSPTKKSKDQ